MRNLALLACTLLLSLSWAAIAAAQPASEPIQRHQNPVVIRFSENLFQSPEPEVDHRSDVDTCVLGIRNRGTARTTGQVSLNFLHSVSDAQLEIVFRGESVSRTRGNKGPASIHSTTRCSFDLRAPIAFADEEGFSWSGALKEDLTLESMCRSVTTSAPGLRGRIVERVAHKRLQEKSGQIRGIAEHNTRERLTSSMTDRVDQKLQGWNEKWLKLRASLQAQSWYPETPKLSFMSDSHHLLLFIVEGTPDLQPPLEINVAEARLPQPHPDALIDIHLLNDWLRNDEDAATLVAYLTATSQSLLIIYFETDGIKVDASEGEIWSTFTIQPEVAE